MVAVLCAAAAATPLPRNVNGFYHTVRPNLHTAKPNGKPGGARSRPLQECEFTLRECGRQPAARPHAVPFQWLSSLVVNACASFCSAYSAASTRCRV